MRLDRRQPVKPPYTNSTAALALFAAALCAGCANPGPPKPPSLHLPKPVKDLVAERAGDQVLLHWTTPSRTTDDMDIKGLLTAELCREVGDRPPTPVARAAACSPVRRLTVTPGPSQIADTLPPALQADPPQLLTYRIQIFNANGHSAGNSAAAYTAAGAAPPTIESLRATTGERGAVLEWKRAQAPTASPADFIDIDRVDLTAAPVEKRQTPQASRPPGKVKSARAPKPDEPPSSEIHLHAGDGSSAANTGIAGTVDTSAVMGGTYTYSAQRVRTVPLSGRSLEIRSSESAPVTLAMRDTFPPKSPTGLAAISGISPASQPNSSATSPYIDLSWEANSENDLAGYRVYRQLARLDGSPQGPLARLTALPIAAPAYRDIAVKPGQGYIYTVTAVDAAGNESAPSAKTLETAPPEAGEPQN